MTISVGYGSSTFEFKSKYPNLHMPAMPVSAAALVEPGNAAQLLDGEFVIIDANGEIARPSAAGAATIEQLGCYASHGNPGRSDLQVGQHVPVVMDEAYEFVTRLHDGNRAGGGGTAPDTTTNALCYVEIASVEIDGTTYAGRSVLTPTTNADDYFVARCISAPDTNGWARFIAIKGSIAA